MPRCLLEAADCAASWSHGAHSGRAGGLGRRAFLDVGCAKDLLEPPGLKERSSSSSSATSFLWLDGAGAHRHTCRGARASTAFLFGKKKASGDFQPPPADDDDGPPYSEEKYWEKLSKGEAPLGMGPELEPKPRIRLMYQTPQIYATDMGLQLSPKTLGWRYACDKPDQAGVGEEGAPPYPHPSITFNGKLRKIHVHLEDTRTHEVFWDADFELKGGIMSMISGKYKLKNTDVPLDPKSVFRKPCVPKDDPYPHSYELTVSTDDTKYEDASPWLLENFGWKNAHIGFEVHRMPKLKEDSKGKTSEIIGAWTEGGSFSKGPIHDQRERILNDEEDLFYDSKSGKSYRGYYHYIVTPLGEKKHMYKHLKKKYADRYLFDQGGEIRGGQLGHLLHRPNGLWRAEEPEPQLGILGGPSVR